MDHFELVSEYQPTGDQPRAIEELVRGFKEGNQFQTLLGATGSGKTFTMANIIQALNKPTLVIAHNKTLAAQLYSEFKEFFPNNAVEYFISYYDYYQPEAYVPSTDTYIEKDASINDEIDRLRHSATTSLVERNDVIIIASVSCIYGIGDPEEYAHMCVSLRPGMQKERDDVIKELISIQYDRNDMDFQRGTFRVRGDVIEIIPVMTDSYAIRIEFFGDEIDRITKIDVLTGLALGVAPATLIDFYKNDYLIIVDESHMTIPQIGAMYNGDRSRKQTLVDFGFRLPSALDNRPLKFEEFESKIDQMLFVSATPGKYEAEHELFRTEQIIRPTGLLDPEVTVKPVEGQIDDLLSEINKETEKGNKVLVTTLTKKMAEDLTDFLKDAGVRVRYLHSDIAALERTEIIREMRLDVFDVLIGINLLREGLDIPEISLVAILDADKEGFLRSETSLIQTIGRASRNAEGHVIMYADVVTGSMKAAMDETARRRAIQQAYNEEHGITPTSIKKAVRDLISITKEAEKTSMKLEKEPESMSAEEIRKLIEKVEKQMRRAAADLDFEAAADLRDQMLELKKHLDDATGGKTRNPKRKNLKKRKEYKS